MSRISGEAPSTSRPSSASIGPRSSCTTSCPRTKSTWAFLEHLRGSDILKGVQFVLTSVNAHRLNEIVSPREEVYEIVGKPYDLDQIVRAVKEASRARPTR